MSLPTNTVVLGDCLEVLRTLPDSSIDAIVTDPPAGIEFMGAEWDTFKRGRLSTYSKPPQSILEKPEGTENWMGALPTFSQRANPRCTVCEHYRFSGTPCQCKAPKWATDHSARDTFVAFMREVMQECLRVLKPGGHAIVWSIPRTSHWTALAIEDAGFEIRDCIYHLFGSGFPKSLDVSKAIDKLDAVEEQEKRRLRFTAWVRSQGVSTKEIDEATGTLMGTHYTSKGSQPAVMTREHLEMCRHLFSEVPEWVEQECDVRSVESRNFAAREVTGHYENAAPGQTWNANYGHKANLVPKERKDIPVTEAARQWAGWGTSLKPSVETWWLCRKPVEAHNVASQVMATGTGALNINACRVGSSGGTRRDGKATEPNDTGWANMRGHGIADLNAGRWPSHLILSHSPDCKRIGSTSIRGNRTDTRPDGDGGRASTEEWRFRPTEATRRGYSDENGQEEVAVYECAEGCPVSALDRQSSEVTGGASRFFNTFEPAYDVPFFYTGKASKSDKNADLEEAELQNIHPTVKSQALMSHFVRLVSPPGGVVLDPFSGSGSTLVAAVMEGMKFVGIEREPTFHRIAEARTKAAMIRYAEMIGQREVFNSMEELPED